ncbi:MAG: hypothetical protein LLF94_08185 [Chlamydiales bacterium]|nr:hypothetical protein [Chlamydiales bacterium]
MTKIILIAEKINDQLAFIRNLRELTGKSISEIRKSLINKTPFFEGEVNGKLGEETEDFILELLRFSNEQGNKIRIFQLFTDNPFEISQEIFKNQVERREEIAKYFKELDELEDV